MRRIDEHTNSHYSEAVIHAKPVQTYRLIADKENARRVALDGNSSGRIAPDNLPAHNEPNISLVEAEHQALQQYRAHGLADLKNASLMDRVDTKFLVPRALLTSMLAVLQNEYTVLEINNQRVARYENSYYDTPSFKHYMAHHNRRLNRFKLRKRTYADSDIAFLEVKFKNNHGRTVKSRKSLAVDEPAMNSNSALLLHESGLSKVAEHKLVQNSTYNRIALANEAAGERITIDLNLHIHDTTTNKQMDIGDWAIVEIKQNVYDRDTAFFEWARSHGLKACSFSKYCMGLYYTGPDFIKRNNFHKINRHITLAARKFPNAIAKPLTVY